MMCAHPYGEGSLYRLALISAKSRELLVEATSRGPVLPRFSIPPRTRPAAELQKEARGRWGVSIFVVDFLKQSAVHPYCAIAELLSQDIPHELATCEIDDVSLAELTFEERDLAENICAGKTSNRGPFSRAGWIQEAIEWIQINTGRAVKPEGVEQYNASATFALACFPMEDGSVFWLKATGKPNQHEFELTRTLARLCPRYLPQLISARSDWNAWLMADAGEPPAQDLHLTAIENVVLIMAELQLETVEHTAALLAAGAEDQRLTILHSRIHEISDYLQRAMERQTSTKVPRLTAVQIKELGCVLERACSAMDQLCVPDTILHGDLNWGNILFRDGIYVFTDWCEAQIGNPFLGFQSLRLLIQNEKDLQQTERRLKDLFGQAWRRRLTSQQIGRAFALSPILAVAVHFLRLYNAAKLSSEDHSEFESYARSLARHMDREAKEDSLLEALCN